MCDDGLVSRHSRVVSEARVASEAKVGLRVPGPSSVFEGRRHMRWKAPRQGALELARWYQSLRVERRREREIGRWLHFTVGDTAGLSYLFFLFIYLFIFLMCSSKALGVAIKS